MRNVFALLALVASFFLLAGCGDAGSKPATAQGEGKARAGKAAVACLQRSAKPPAGGHGSQIERKGPKGLHLTLKGFPDAADAGILLAARRGYFTDVGLSLEITSPVVTDNLPGYLVEGDTDVGVLPQPQVAIANSEGMPLVAIGSLMQRPAMAMMSLESSGVDTIADLEGRTVAINGLPAEEAVLEAILDRAGLSIEDVKLRRAGYGLLQALVDGHADAILGVSRNVEGIELEACGIEPVVVPLRKLGVPPYEELDLVVRRDRLAEFPERFRAFMSALARGTAAAAAHPRAAAEAISVYRARLDAGDPQRLALVQEKIRATLPLLSKSNSMSPARATRFTAWMHDQGLIEREVPVSQLLTNRFVRH